MKASEVMRDYSYIVFPLIVLHLLASGASRRRSRDDAWWDRTRVRPAGIGKVVLKIGMARFSRTLSSLVGAGVDIMQALEITGSTSGQQPHRGRDQEVRDRVQQGSPIAQPLSETAIFPPMVAHMVRVGEETGELEKMLTKVADFYEDEVDASIQSLTSIIEPLLMIMVGFIVGIIVIAMYLPMFKILTLIK